MPEGLLPSRVMPSLILKRGRERRLIAGHPWAYAGEVATITGEPANGDAVDIRAHKVGSHGDNFQARRYCFGRRYSPSSFRFEARCGHERPLVERLPRRSAQMDVEELARIPSRACQTSPCVQTARHT
jgi:PUA-like domain